MATRASSLITFAHNSGEMIGPVAVGVIIALYGADWAFAFIAVLYLAGAYFILIVPMPERNSDVDYYHIPYLTLLRIGMRNVRRNQPLPWLLSILAVTNLFGVAVFPLIPEYAIEVFDSGGIGFGLMTGTVGGGFAVGSAIFSILHLPRRIPLIVISCSLIWGAGCIAFAYAPNLPVTLGVLFVMGLASIIWVNSILRLIQSQTPHTSRGRVMSVYTIALGLIPIGWAVGGAIATFAGNETALIVSGGASVTVSIAAYIASPAFRRA